MIDSRLLKKLIQSFMQTKSAAKEIETLLQTLLTSAELHDISLRLEILKRLKRGDTQRSIAEELGVGIATVTRGSRQLQELEGRLDSFLE
jgi:TrpR family trp operon transcriptional repressor